MAYRKQMIEALGKAGYMWEEAEELADKLIRMKRTDDFDYKQKIEQIAKDRGHVSLQDIRKEIYRTPSLFFVPAPVIVSPSHDETTRAIETAKAIATPAPTVILPSVEAEPEPTESLAEIFEDTVQVEVASAEETLESTSGSANAAFKSHLSTSVNRVPIIRTQFRAVERPTARPVGNRHQRRKAAVLSGKTPSGPK